MENYPFFVIRERGRLNYAQESERIEGAKRRLKQYRAGSKAKQKVRISRLLQRSPNEKISEDDLYDLKRNLSDDINQLTKDVQQLKSKLTYLDQINEIQKGSLCNNQSTPLIEKYVKTNSPDYRVLDLEIERDALYNELKYLREATTPNSIEDLQEESKEHTEKILEIMSDCRYFQKLIDELDVKVQNFKPDPEYETAKNKKEEIKKTLKNEVELNEQLKQILYSGTEINIQSQPDIDYEDTVLPFTQELIFLKHTLDEKKKELDDLKQKNQQELDDINNKKRSPDFFVTYRTLEDFDLNKKKKEESKNKQNQFELYQRLNTFHRTSIKEKSTPSITKPTIQSLNQTPVQVQVQVQNNNNDDQPAQTQSPKKKVIRKIGPPTFHQTKHDMIINQLMQEKEKEKEKPVRRVKETSPHLLEPRKKPQHPPDEVKTIKFYKKPPKSSQPKVHWKSQAQTQTQPQKQEQEKFKDHKKNGYFVTQQVDKTEDEEEEKGDKLSFSQMMEKITNKLRTETESEQKEQESEKIKEKDSESKNDDEKKETEIKQDETKENEDKKNETKENAGKKDETKENEDKKDEIKENEDKKDETKENEEKNEIDTKGTKQDETKENESKSSIKNIDASFVESVFANKDTTEEAKSINDKEDPKDKEETSTESKEKDQNNETYETDKKKSENEEEKNEKTESEKEKEETKNEDDEQEKENKDNKQTNLIGGLLNTLANQLVNNEKVEESEDNNKDKDNDKKDISESEKDMRSEKISEVEKDEMNSNEPENKKTKEAALSSPMNSTLNDDFESFDENNRQSDQNQSHEKSSSDKTSHSSDSDAKESDQINKEKEESEQSSKDKNESEKDSTEKEKSDESSKEKDESERDSTEKDKSEESENNYIESGTNNTEKDKSDESEKVKNESEKSNSEGNNKEKNNGLLSGLMNSVAGDLLKQSDNNKKDKTEENDDDIVSASLSGEGKKKASSNDGGSDSF